MRLLLTIPFLLSCSSLELHYPEPEPGYTSLNINLSSECVLKPSMGVVYFMIVDDKLLPSIACEMNAWGCTISKGNKHYVYSVTDWAIYFEEMGHAAGCSIHAY